MIVVSRCTRKPSIKLVFIITAKTVSVNVLWSHSCKKKPMASIVRADALIQKPFPQVRIPLISNMNMNNIQVEFFFTASKMRSPAKASRDAVRPTWDNFRMILPKKRLRYIETRHRQKLTQKHRHKTRNASPGVSRRLVASEGGWALGFPVFQPCQELNQNFFLERLDLLLLDFPLSSLFPLLARHHKQLLQPVFDHASLGWKEPGELFYSSTQVMFAHLNQSENDPVKVWLQRGARLEGPGQVGWCVEVPFGLE